MKQTLKGISKSQSDFSGAEKFIPQPNFGWPFRLLAFLIAFAVFFQGPVLVAATITWDPFKLYSSGTVGVSSGTAYSGTFSTLSSGHWLATGSTLGSTVVPGTSDVVILNLGSASYSITLSTGTIASIAGGTVSAGSGLAGTTVSFAGSGTLAIGGTGFTVNAGTLSLASSVLVKLLASQTWSVSAGSQMLVAGTITGTGFDLTKSGGGILTLSGSGGYTGSTYITAGTLSAGTGSLANTGTIVLSGGSLSAVDVKSGALFTGSVGTTASFSSGTLTLGTVAEFGSLTFSGTSGTVVLGSLSGTGVTTFASSGSISSGSITGGTVSVASNLSSSVSGGSVTVGGIFTGGTVSGGSLNLTGSGSSSITTLSGGTIANSGTLQITTGTYAGGLSGTGALMKVGATQLTLSGANTYTGSTYITAGTLSAVSGALANTGTILLSGGSLSAVDVKSGALFTGSIGTTASFSSTSLTLGTVAEFGTLTFSGTSGTVVLGSLSGTGVTTFASSGSISSGSITGGTVSVASNLSSSVSGGSVTVGGTFTSAVLSGGTVTVAGLTNEALLSGGSLIANGGGTLTTMTAGALTVGSLATLTLGTVTGSGTIADNGSLSISAGTLNGVLSGTGALSKTGTDVLNLNGSNNFSGSITVAAGTLNAGTFGSSTALTLASGARGFVSGATSLGTVANEGSLNFTVASGLVSLASLSGNGATNFTGATSTGSISSGSITAGTVTATGSLIANVSGGSVTVGGILTAGTVSGGSLNLTGSGSSSITTLSGGTIANSGTLQITTGTYAGGLSGTGALMKVGATQLTLSGANTYTGSTYITAGTLSAVSGALANTGTILLSGGSLSAVDVKSGALFTGSIGTTASFSSTSLTLGTVAEFGSLTFSGTSGTVVLGSLSGTGVTTFASSGSISSGSITGGTVSVASNLSSNVSGGSVTVGGTFTSAVMSGGTVTVAGLTNETLLSGGSLIANGGGTLTTMTAGALTVGSLATLTLGTVSGGAAIADNGSLSISSGALAGVLSGSGSLTKTGAASTLTLSSNLNTFSGTLNIAGGTLSTTAVNALQAVSVVNVNAGSLIAISLPSTALLNVGTGASASFSSATVNLGTLSSSGLVSFGSSVTTGSIATLSLSSTGVTTFASNSAIVTLGSLIGNGTISMTGNGGSLTLTSGSITQATVNLTSSSLTANISGGSVSVKTLSSPNQTISGGTVSVTASGISTLGTLSGGTVSLVSGATLQLSSGTYSDGGGIRGAGSLSKTGLGLLILGTQSAYSGTTSISGTLQATVAGALGATSSITLNGGSTLSAVDVGTASPALTLGAAAVATISGTNGLSLLGVTNNGTLNFNGTSGTVSLSSLSGAAGISTFSSAATVSGSVNSGTVSVSGALSSNVIAGGSVTVGGYFTGGTVSGGSLSLGSGGSVTTLNGGTLQGTGTLTVSLSAGTSTTVLKGALSLLKTGAGTLTLGGASTFAGDTTLNAGVLSLNNAAALGTGTLILAGGSLNNTSGGLITLNNNVQNWSSDVTFLGSNPLNLGSGSVTVTADRTVNVVASTLTVGGSISAVGATLTKAGSGALVLSGTNSFGGVSMTAGSLLLQSQNALSGGSLSLTGGTMDLGGYVQSITSGSFISGKILNGTISSSSVLTVSSFDIGVRLTGTGSLLKQGSGSVVITGVGNNFDGGANLNGGTLFLNSDAALGTGTLNINGGSLGVSTTGLVTLSSNPQTWSSDFSFFGPGTLATGGGAVTMTDNRTVNVASGSLNVGGVIGDGGSAFNLVKSGSGMLVLGAVNTFSGDFVLNAGSVNTTATGALGGGNVTVTTGNLNLQSTSQDVAGTLTVAGGIVSGGTLNLSGSGLALSGGTISAVLNGNGGFVKDGTGLAVLSGSNSFTGNMTLRGGTLALHNDGALGSVGNLTIESGSLANTSGADHIVSNPYSQIWAGSFGFVGTNNLTFAQSITLQKDITLNVSTGKLTEGGAISGTYTLTKTGDGTLEFTGSSTGFSGGVSVLAGTLLLSAADTLPGISSLSLSGGSIDLGGGSQSFSSLTVSGGFLGDGTLTASGTIFLNAGELAAVTGGSASLVKSGSGTATLSQANAYTGGTNISAGTLYLGDNSALGNGSLTLSGGSLGVKADLSIALTGVDQKVWSSNFSFFGGTLDTGTGAVSMTQSVLVNVNSGSLIEGGVISGTSAAFGLTKTGNGTLQLSGVNTYSGTTTVNGGLLFVPTGSLGATSAISIGTAGSVLFADSGLTISVPYVNNGSLTFSATSGTISLGSLTGMGSATFGSDAIITSSISGGQMTVANALTANISAGTVQAAVVTVGTMSGGSLTLTDPAQISSITSLSGGAYLQNAGTLSLFSGTFSGVVAGDGLIVKSGSSNKLTLSGSNTFTGTVDVLEGTLSAKQFGSTATLFVGSVAAANITGISPSLGDVFNDGSLTFSGATGTATLASLSGNSTPGGTTTFLSNGSIGSGFSGGVLRAVGDLLLQGDISDGTISAGAIANGLANGMTISGGSLNVSGVISLLQINGGVVTQTGLENRDVTLNYMSGGTLTTTGNLTVRNGVAFIDIAGGSINVGQVASFGHITGGTFKINGAADIDKIFAGYFDFHGATTVNYLYGGSILLNGPLSVNRGSYTGASGIISGTSDFIKSSTPTTNSASFADLSYLIMPGSLLLNGHKTGQLTDWINLPSVPIANLTAPVGIIVAPGSAVLSGTAYTRTDTGWQIVRKDETLSLSGINTYTGATFVHGGNLVLDKDAVNSTSSIIVDGGGIQGFYSISPNQPLTVINGTTYYGDLRTNITTMVMGGSLTAVNVNPSGNTSLTVGTYGVATFTGGGLKFLNIQNDAPSQYQLTTTRLDGSVLLAQSGLYFPNVDSQGTISIGNLSGTGYTYIESNLSGGTISISGDGLNGGLGVGLVVRGTIYSDIASGHVSAGAIRNRNISGGNIIAGGVNVSGSFTGGTLTVSGTSTFGTVTFLSDGSLILKGQTEIGSYAGNNTPTQSLNINSSATVGQINGGFNLTGVLTTSSGTLFGLNLDSGNNSGGVIKVGTYTTLILSGTNNYGSTTLSEGTLQLASSTGLGKSALNLNSGVTLGNISGAPLTFAMPQSWNGDFTFTGPDSLTFSSGSVALASTSTITVTAGSFTEGGAINGGSAGLTKKGDGTLVLGGFGNFSGGFNASGGSVYATLSNALGSGTVTVDSSSTLNLGTTTQAVSGFVLGGSASSGNVFGGTISADNFTLLSGQMNSKLSDGPSGLGSLTKSGTGTAVLSGSMSYTGQTAVSGGSLEFSQTGLALSGAVVNDAQLRFSATSGTVSLSSLSGSGTTQFSKDGQIGVLTSGTVSTVGTLLVTSGTFLGSLIGSTSLEKIGTGSLLTLSGTSTNTGSTKVSAGTLRSTIPGALSKTSSLLAAGGLLDVVDYNPNITLSVGSLGTAQITGSSLALTGGANNAGSLSFTAASGTLSLGSLAGAGTTYFAGNAIIGGSISEGVVRAADTATLYATVAGGSVTTGALNSTTLYGGTITLNAGTSLIHTFSGGATLTIGTPASLQVYNGTLSGINGGGTVVKVGSADSLTFAGGTSFTGTMSVVAGTMTADSFGTSALLNVGTYGFATISGTSNISLGAVVNGGSVLFSGTSGTVTLASLNGVGVTNFLSNGSITAGLSDGNVFVKGTLTLGGAFSGGNLTANQLVATSITGGSLILSGSGISQIGVVSGGTLTNNATLQINSGTIANEIGGTGILLKMGTFDTLSVQQGKLPQIGGVSILEGTFNAVDFGTLTATNLVVGSLGIGVISGTGISIGNVSNVGSLTFSGGTVSLTSLSGSGITTFANEAAISGTLSGGTVSVTGAFSAGVLSGGSLTLLSNGTVGLLNGGSLSSGSALVVTGSSGTALATGTGGTVLQGALSLEMRGSGAVSLAAVNTYTGGTTLTAGTLNLNNAAALGGGSFSIAGGALNNTSGAAVRLNDHSETWSGDFRFLGTNDLNLGAGTFTLAGLQKLTVDAGTLTVAGLISGGSDGFTKEGNGALVLSGSAAFTGGTNVNGGLLLLGGSSALAGATLTVSAGSVDLGGNTQAVGNVSLLAGGYIGNGTLASSGSVSVNSGVIAAVISGSSVVTKSGTGSASLSIANYYTGGTVINGGTLNINNAHAIGDGTLSLASGAGIGTTVAAGITLSTNNAQIWSGSFSFSGYTLDMGTGAITMSGNPVITVNSGSLLEGGAITGGSSSLTKAGNGTLLLSGSNSFTGGTKVNGGTLLLKGTNALAGGALTVNSGSIDLDGSTQLVGDVRLSAGGYIGNGTISSSGSVSLDAGVIAAVIGGTGSVTKSNNGTVALGRVNTYGGGTFLKGGTLDIGISGAIGSGSLYIDGGSLSATSGSFTLNNTQVWKTDFSFSGLSLTMGTGAVTVTDNRTLNVVSGTLTIGGNISGGTSSLTKDGNGTLLLSGNNSFTGGTNVNGGKLLLGGTNALAGGALTVSSGSVDLNGSTQLVGDVRLLADGYIGNGTISSSGSVSLDAGTIAAVIGGTGFVTKSNAGTVILSQANTYSGGTFLRGGTLDIGINSAIGSGSLYIEGGSLSATGGSFTLNNAQVWKTDFSFSGISLSMGTGAVSVTDNRTLNVLSGTLTIGGNISGGTSSLTKDGNGTLLLGGSSTFGGGLSVSAGTLALGSSAKLTTASALTASGGVFSLGGGSFTFSQVSLTGGTISNGTVFSTVDYALQSGSVSAVLAGTSALLKSGAGRLTLSGANTYTGATSVSGGMLVVTSVGALANTSGIGVTGGSLDAVDYNGNVLLNVGAAGTASFSGAGLSLGTIYSDGLLNFRAVTGSITVGTLSGSGLTTFANDANLSAAFQSGQLVVGGTLNADITSGTVTAGVLSSGTIGGGLITTTNAASSSSVTNLNGGTFVLGGSLLVTSGTYSGGGFSGTGTLVKVGSGTTLKINSPANYTAPTTVAAGTLLVTNSGTFAAVQNEATIEFRASADLASLSGAGTTSFNGGTASVGALNGNSITGSAVLAVSSGTHNSGVIGGSIALVKTGNGALTLGSADSYTGGTTLVAGTLTVNNAGALGSGSLRIEGGSLATSAGSVTLSSNNAQVWAGSFGFSGGTLDMGTGAVTLSGSQSLTISSGVFIERGAISGAFGLTKFGAGNLVLAGANTFTGGVNVTAGTLTLLGSGGFGTGNLTLGSNATLDITNSPLTLQNVIIQGGKILGSVAISGANPIGGVSDVKLTGTGTVVVDTATADSGTLFVLNNQSTYSGGTELKADSQILSFGTSSVGNASGPIGTGLLKVLASGSIDASTANVNLTTNNALVLAGTLTFVGTNDLNLGAGSVSLQDTQAVITSKNTLTVGGSISGAGSLNKMGAGTLKLTGSSLSQSGTTKVSEGILEFANSATVFAPVQLVGGTLKVDSGTVLTVGVLNYSGGSLTGSGSVKASTVSVDTGLNLNSGTTLFTGSLAQIGNGTLTLSSSALSQMTLTAGSLRILSAGALGSANLVIDGGTFDTTAFSGGTLSVSSLNLNNSSTFNVAAGKELNTGTGAVNVLSSSTLNISGGTVTFGGPLTISKGANFQTTGSGSINFLGDISGSLTVSGSQTLKSGSTIDALSLLPGAVINLVGSLNATTLNIPSGGTIVQSGSGVVTGAWTFGTSGTPGGTLRVVANAVASFVGTLKGSGSIDGPGTVDFSKGAFDIGYSPGILLLTGSVSALAPQTSKWDYVVPADLSSDLLRNATKDYSNNTIASSPFSDRVVVQAGGSLTFKAGQTMTLTPNNFSGNRLPVGSLEFPVVIVNGGTINALTASGSYIAVGSSNVSSYFKTDFNSSPVISGAFSVVEGGTVDLIVTRNNYAAVTHNSGNLRQTASILDSSMLNGGSAAITAIGTLFTALDSRTTANEIDTILAALNPAPYTELGNMGMSRMMDLQAAIQGHLDTLAIGVLSDVEPSPGEARESSAWTSVYSGWANRDGSSSQGLAGYSSRNYGSISGVEHRFGDLTLGLTGAVGSTSATFKQTSSSLSADTWHAGLYASAPIDLEDFGVVFDAGLVYGEGDSTVRRSLSGAGLGLGTFTGKVASTEWMAQIGASVPSVLPDDTYTVTPSLHLLYGSYRQGAINEITEGTLAALGARVGAFSQSSAATRLGLQGAKLLRVAQMPARLTASANWLHSFDAAGRQVDISFATPGATAQKFGSSRAGMDAFRIGLGGEIAITDRTRFQLTIDHQLQKGQSNTSGNASIGVQF